MGKKELRWLRLDNAAKIYPAARRRNWNNMFRISATLCDPIDPVILQQAVEKVLPRFPSIGVRLRRGLFWYYLEETEQIPAVQQDTWCPLSRMRFSDIRKCAIRVLYYENRIAVELYHALTDGNGGLIFLKTLVAEYIRQRYGESVPCTDGVLDCAQHPDSEELEDSFVKYCGNIKASRREPSAYRIRGLREADGFLHITTGILKADAVYEMAHRYGATVTEFLTAAMIMSILELQKKDHPYRWNRRSVKVLVPVNLRRLFPSKSLRNFVLFYTTGIDPALGDYTLEEVVRIVHHQAGLEITPKRMQARITTNVRTEQIALVKVLPLFIKNIAMKMVYNLVGESKACLTISNLGRIQLPEEMHRYVNRCDFVLGAQVQQHNNCAVLTYGNTLYINFTRDIKEAKLEYMFFKYLRKLGLHILLESNQR